MPSALLYYTLYQQVNSKAAVAGSRFSAAEEGGLLRGVQKSGYLIPLKEASYDFAF